MEKYWQFLNKKNDSVEILLYGEIGESMWSNGIGAKQFAEDLQALGKGIKNIVLRINSPGGSVFEGLAIYNLLKNHQANIEVHVDGIAASIASVIAMAGDKIIMPENAIIMIHDPMGLVQGTSDDMQKMVEALGKIKLGIISAYRDKTGLEDKEISKLMNHETWFTASEAVEQGFADEVQEAMKIAASFDLSKFQNIPKKVLNQYDRIINEDNNIILLSDELKQALGDIKSAIINNPTKKEDTKMMCSKCSKEHANLVNGICPDCIQAQTNIDVAINDTRQAEQTRVADILAMGDSHKCLDVARQHIKDGKSVEEFKTEILTKVYNAKPATPISPELGMSGSEVEQFSIVKAIRQISEFKPLDGIEKEASDATAKIARREPKGFFIPHDVMRQQLNLARAMQIKNALSAGDSTAGGYLIGTDVLVSDMIELLRNKTLVAQLGARVLSGLVGNIAIPRITGGATAYWLPETGTVTASTQSFGQLGLVPRRLVADTAYSKELMMQTSLDIESFVREDLMRVLGLAKDLAAINGAGSDGEPLGIMNVTGIGSVTFGAAPTWAKVVEFETDVANANADLGPMAYLTTPNVRGSWKTTPKVTAQPVYLWQDGATPGSGVVNGYRAEATKQVPSDKVIFGNWNDLILADWAGVDVVVDPYSLKKSGQIEITITIHSDSGVRHAASFSVSSDAGNQ